uniref:Uncharacterized protein n=1 Tax=Fagus sylvatica TaxID=28930 RepID=A0A2N9HJY9_FAGSY
MPVEPTVLFVAQPTSISPQVDHPDLIPTREVSEMAPSIDAYELMGKKSKRASSSKGKGKAKQGAQPKKRHMGTRDDGGTGPTVRPPYCARYLQRRALVQGQIFRHISRGLVLAAQGVHTMEARVFHLNKRLKNKEAEHNKALAEVMESATANYLALEKEHFNALNNMKKAEERARTEAEQKAKMEAEAGLKDSDDEDEEDDEDEAEEAGGEQDYQVVDSASGLNDNPLAPSNPAPVDPAPPTES